MNVSWLLQGRSFPSCAEECGNALLCWQAAHGGQDDRVVPWVGTLTFLRSPAILPAHYLYYATIV